MRNEILAIIALYHKNISINNDIEDFVSALEVEIEDPLKNSISGDALGLSKQDIELLVSSGKITSNEALDFSTILLDYRNIF